MIRNGRYDGAPWLPEYGCGDFSRMWRSCTAAINIRYHRSAARASPAGISWHAESDLEDGDMLYGQHRDTAQFELEFYILCRIIGGFTWNPETMGKWFWQSEKRQGPGDTQKMGGTR